MSTSKSLAWAQIGIISASLVMSIMITIHLGQGKGLSLGEISGLLSGTLSISFAGFILGIMQIIYSSKDNNKMGLIAGIFSLLIVLPFVEILSLGVNFLIVTEEPLNN